eukprot:6809932-Pyramimonas_sp.AAC.1
MRWEKPAPSHIEAALATAHAIQNPACLAAQRGATRRAVIGLRRGRNSPATERGAHARANMSRARGQC